MGKMVLTGDIQKASRGTMPVCVRTRTGRHCAPTRKINLY